MAALLGPALRGPTAWQGVVVAVRPLVLVVAPHHRHRCRVRRLGLGARAQPLGLQQLEVVLLEPFLQSALWSPVWVLLEALRPRVR